VYVLRLDPKTLSKRYKLLEQERSITVQPTKEEFMEIKLPDLVVGIKEEGKAPNAGSTKPKEEKSLTLDPNQVPL
jgi:hypothetical protein